MMSHEFRTPVSTTLMFLNLILNKITDEYCKKLLLLVIGSLNLLLSLVNDVVDLKMLKEGRFMKNEKTFSPRQVLDFII